jgi:hypothetical protein
MLSYMNPFCKLILYLIIPQALAISAANASEPRRLATGNLSVDEIMRSPIGAHPDLGYGSGGIRGLRGVGDD